MYEVSRIGVVVPAFNEQDFIGEVIATMPAFVDHIIVVDDASTDRTYDVALGSADARVTVIRSPENRGVGGAMALGFAEALARRCDIVAKMDGDAQMAPEHLSRLIDPLVREGYDYAKGNRFLSPGSLAVMPLPRLLANIGLTFLTKLASGYWHVFDPQNGFVAITAGTLKSLRLEQIHPGYFFENDMLVQLNLCSARVRDVAIPARYAQEVSHVSFANVALTFPLLLTQRFFRRIIARFVVRDLSPIALFLFLGATLFSWGGFFGGFLWVRTLRSGIATPTGSIMLALVPLILGFQLLLQAIVLDIQESQKLR